MDLINASLAKLEAAIAVKRARERFYKAQESALDELRHRPAFMPIWQEVMDAKSALAEANTKYINAR